MVLDPVSAFGIAGNVVQFVDFSIKLVSKAKEVLDHGGLVEHRHLRRCAQQIKDFHSLLETRLKGFSNPSIDQVAIASSSFAAEQQEDPVTSLLRLALSHCNECAEELLGAIEKLTVSGSYPRWQSFRQALTSMLGEAGLEKTSQRLFQAQQNVVLFLVLFTSSGQTNTSAILHSNFALEKNILLAVKESTIGVKEQIEALRKDFETTDRAKIDSYARTSHDQNAEFLDDVGFNVGLALPVVARDKFLQSLNFKRIDDRYDRIARAHRRTLQWVLEPDERGSVTWDKFPSWLNAKDGGQNIYWITGKPGSGKSTLMRYLADSDKTREIISKSAAPNPFQVLKCFFWNPGSSMQRSMEGLLRTLVYQALSQENVDHDVIQAVSPHRWHSFMYDWRPVVEWSLADLSVLFRDMVQVLTKTMKLVFFVDGLDEFGNDLEDRETLVKMFLDLEMLPNLKMCLSSRPWNEFKDRLSIFPHLKLEDLTKQDMREFAGSELGSSRALQDLTAVASDGIKQLQEQLVNKSDGVFLWLFLVTKRLKVAAQDGKPLRKLVEIVDQMPPDLDDFFRLMLERIPDSDRIQASRIFQIMLESTSTTLPSLMMLSFTDEDTVDFALVEAMQLEDKPEIQSRTVALRRRLDSQCMDLLVCAPSKETKGEAWDDTCVEYLHRTVIDFLTSRPAQDILLSYSDGRLDISWFKCNAALTQVMFMNKFVTEWSSTSYDQQSVQIRRFQDCLGRLWSHPNMHAVGAKQVFELLVEQIDPLVRGKQLGINRQIFLKDNESQRAAESVYRSYQHHIVSANDPRLLMALLAGFEHYAESYVSQLPNDTDTCSYFTCALAPVASTKKLPGPKLLCDILSPGQRFPNIDVAHVMITNFRLTVTGLGFAAAQAYCKVIDELLQKTKGLRATKAELENLYLVCEDCIQTYISSETSALLKCLQETRKTWKPVQKDKAATKKPGIPLSTTLLGAANASVHFAGSNWTPPRLPTPDPSDAAREPAVISSMRRPSPVPILTRKMPSWIRSILKSKSKAAA